MKKSMFGKLLLSGCVLLAGCNGLSESGQRTKGNEFLGTWEKKEGKCPKCDVWVFSRTSEGKVKAEKLRTADLQFPYRRLSYATSYDTGNDQLILHAGIDFKATIDNGQLTVLGHTYNRVDQ